jgi:hypothetical protein
MNAMHVFVGTIAVTASIATAGCASQSGAFRQMSAADHERAATASPDGALAQEHLEAARRLQSDERAACDGVPDADRLNGPFGPAHYVTNVEVVRDRGRFPKGPQQPVGVAVFVRAEPGLTQQWLGRVVACNMAHLAVVGGVERPSPLSVADTNVSVSSTAVGFRVTFTSKDSDVARSLVDKGEELVASRNGRPDHTGAGVASTR